MRVRDRFRLAASGALVDLKHEAMPAIPQAIALTDARLCADCDTIFAGRHACPACAGSSWQSLARALNRPALKAS